MSNEIIEIEDKDYEYTYACLAYSLDKSGIDAAKEMMGYVVLIDDADKTTSSVMGSIVAPSEEHPKGLILLYIDAIKDYAAFIGRDFRLVAVKVMLCQLHNLIRYRSQENFKFQTAERFATKACETLIKEGVIDIMPPIFYIDTTNEIMKYNMVLRQEWIKKWTGLELSEVAMVLNHNS